MVFHLERLLRLVEESKFVGLSIGQRHVRTPAGATKYGEPIGSPITANMIKKVERAAGKTTSKSPSAGAAKPPGAGTLPVHPAMASAPKRYDSRVPIGRRTPAQIASSTKLPVPPKPAPVKKVVLPKPVKLEDQYPGLDTSKVAEIQVSLDHMIHSDETAKAPKQTGFDSWDKLSAQAAKDKAEYDEILKAAAEQPKSSPLLAPLKGKERAQEKVDGKYGGDWNRLQDVVRGSLIVDDLSSMPDTMAALRRNAEAKGWKIKSFENRFNTPPPPWDTGPTSAGYRDSSLVLVSPNGINAEVQINTKSMADAKEKGHVWYEEIRPILERAASGGAPISASEKALIDDRTKKSSELYNKAHIESYPQDAHLPDTKAIAANKIAAKKTAAAPSKAAPRGRNTTGMSPVANDDKAARAQFKDTVGKPIPPAWTDVHIADDLANAKVLAIGRDSKGRAVSMASAKSMEANAADKFDRLKGVADVIPRLDEMLKRDVIVNDTAAAAFLMRRMGIRVGSTADTKAKQQAYGATTLEARHVKVDGDTITFDFVGKKGVQIHLEQKNDPAMAMMFTHYMNGKSETDKIFNTTPDKTISYIRSATGNAHMKNHDLRTHLANVVALQSIKSHNAQPKTQAEFNKLRNEVGDEVSKRLGNNRTEALKSYINPAVFLAWSPDGTWL